MMTLTNVEIDCRYGPFVTETAEETGLSAEETGLRNIVSCPTLKVYKHRGLKSCYKVLSYLLPMLDARTSALEELNLGRERFDLQKSKHLVDVLKKNYTIQRLGIDYCVWEGREEMLYNKKSLEIILELNQRGRRYMIQNPGSRHRGVEVLSAIVKDPIQFNFRDIRGETTATEDLRLDCLYFHLRENPLLCDCNKG